MAAPLMVPLGLPRRQANFLALLQVRSSLTRREYQLLAGISHVTAARDLAELLEAGVIQRTGAARATRYYRTTIDQQSA